jgi:hypothetical protein
LPLGGGLNLWEKLVMMNNLNQIKMEELINLNEQLAEIADKIDQIAGTQNYKNGSALVNISFAITEQINMLNHFISGDE